MAAVDFAIAGAQKSGTTSLRHMLCSHHRIWMPRGECHWFDMPGARPDGLSDYLLNGDCTPSYMWLERSPPRMAEHNPAMKAICILRHPTDRAWSHYWMERRRGFESRPFLRAVGDELMEREGQSEIQHVRYSYVERGFYDEQLSRMASFGIRTLAVGFSLLGRPNELMGTVCEFLGVEPIRTVALHHRRQKYPEMSRDDRAFLDDVFADTVSRIFDSTGIDLEEER